MSVTSPEARATRAECRGQVEQRTLSLGDVAEMCAACEKCGED